MSRHLSLCLALASVAGAASGAPAVQSSSDQAEQVFLTIYNAGRALVRELRTVELPAGELDLEYADVAAQIDPTTVHITSLSHPGQLGVLEQNFEFDLLSPERLLENFVGRDITIRSRSTADPNQTLSRTGTLLSVQGGRIVRTPEGLILNPEGEISVPGDTGDLRAEPTLVWLLSNAAAGAHQLEASYLTTGLSWHADYVAVVNEDDTRMDLTAWVTIENRSGATFRDARLKLVAGTPNIVQPPQMQDLYMMERAAVAAAPGAPQFTEQAFFEYHLYTLQRPTTVRDMQTKQMSLFTAGDVPVTKRFLFEAQQLYPWFQTGGQRGEPEHVQVVVEFENSEANRMGMPMPQGTVRLYKADPDGALQFIGEDRIEHTPRDERVRLQVGEAFDVVAERVQTAFRQVAGNDTEQDWEITVRNHKDEAITVTLVEHAGGDWTIRQESQGHSDVDATTFEYTVEVPAHGSATVTYTIHFDND